MKNEGKEGKERKEEREEKEGSEQNDKRNKTTYVGVSSKIQTLCHMTQVLLKWRFTAMERLTGD